uniref:Ig-like domain-containing protein n=1 Tax=Callithrix jacchus TaxID=9483 RepID=A0A8I3WY78_CALJA|nr:T cell receptor alpha variable 8-6 [Callithrix jacchus]
MLLLLVPVLAVIFVLGGTRAQSVTQLDGQVTVSEEAPVLLKCNYSSSVTVYPFWYVQYPNQGLQLLLKYLSGPTLVKGIKGFEAEIKKSESSFHLRKSSAHVSDAAEYFCAVSDTVPETAGELNTNPLRC